MSDFFGCKTLNIRYFDLDICMLVEHNIVDTRI